MLKEVHLIAQPLNSSARNEYGALQSVIHLAVQAPGNSGYQAVLGLYRSFAGIHQKESAGAVGVLDLSRVEASLPEQSALLVSGSSGNRDGTAENGRIRLSVNAGARLGLGEHALWNIKDLEEFFRSDWFKTLTDLDGEMLIKRLNEETKYGF
jgi:hypothetical protein